MKTTFKLVPHLMLGAAAMLPFAAAQAEMPAQLAKYGCTGCHAVDTKIVGPAFKEVAAKFKGQDGAKAELTAAIKNGGSGKWGPVPMPPQPTVTDEDLAAIVDWLVGGAQ